MAYVSRPHWPDCVLFLKTGPVMYNSAAQAAEDLRRRGYAVGEIPSRTKSKDISEETLARLLPWETTEARPGGEKHRFQEQIRESYCNDVKLKYRLMSTGKRQSHQTFFSTSEGPTLWPGPSVSKVTWQLFWWMFSSLFYSTVPYVLLFYTVLFITIGPGWYKSNVSNVRLMQYQHFNILSLNVKCHYPRFRCWKSFWFSRVGISLSSNGEIWLQ